MKLRRARSLRFELDDGRKFVVPPPTSGQVRRCMELDPEDPTVETRAEQLERLQKQVATFLNDHTDTAGLIETLTFEEITQVLRAIIAHVHGFDPEDALAWHALLKKKALETSGSPA